MSIRRLFWLGAAVLFSVAAIIAIAAVLGSGLGRTGTGFSRRAVSR